MTHEVTAPALAAIPTFDLKGRVALVTGAGRGIGRAIALALAHHGAAVAVQDLDLAVAAEAAAAIRSTGRAAMHLGGDCTDPDFADTVHRAVAAELGDIHILINNAAVQEWADWTTATVDRINWQYRGNVLSPWLLARLCVPAMKAAKWGRIVGISSVQAVRPAAGMLAYGMTKSAINTMTLALARELGPSGITVNAIAPGYFDTHRNRDQFPDAEAKRRNGSLSPLGRVGEPEDITGTAVLLCSNAGAYITGQVIHVDGGLTLR